MNKLNIIIFISLLTSCSEYGSTEYKEGKYKEITIEDTYPDLVIRASSFIEEDASLNYSILKKKSDRVSKIIIYKSGNKVEEFGFHYNICGYLVMVLNINYKENEYLIAVTESSGGDKFFVSPTKSSALDYDEILNKHLAVCKE